MPLMLDKRSFSEYPPDEPTPSTSDGTPGIMQKKNVRVNKNGTLNGTNTSLYDTSRNTKANT